MHNACKMTFGNDWDSYQKDLEKFILLIKNDSENEWQIEMVKSPETTYLKRISYSSNKSGLFKIEHLLHYSISYGVPVLSFNVWSQTGSPLDLESIMQLKEFHKLAENKQSTAITQQEHPVLFRPYFMIHPCHTEEVIESLKESKNKLITYLSTYGPIVGLHCQFQFASLLNKNNP